MKQRIALVSVALAAALMAAQAAHGQGFTLTCADCDDVNGLQQPRGAGIATLVSELDRLHVQMSIDTVEDLIALENASASIRSADNALITELDPRYPGSPDFRTPECGFDLAGDNEVFAALYTGRAKVVFYDGTSTLSGDLPPLFVPEHWRTMFVPIGADGRCRAGFSELEGLFEVVCWGVSGEAQLLDDSGEVIGEFFDDGQSHYFAADLATIPPPLLVANTSFMNIRSGPYEAALDRCWYQVSNLCLNDGRFWVSAEYGVLQGQLSEGTAVELKDDTGAFWFFNPDNLEITVKVLNGCGVNNHFWVFASGLTNVEVDLTVTDTASGETKTYHNPLGTAFQPIQDTSAFATCP